MTHDPDWKQSVERDMAVVRDKAENMTKAAVIWHNHGHECTSDDEHGGRCLIARRYIHACEMWLEQMLAVLPEVEKRAGQPADQDLFFEVKVAMVRLQVWAKEYATAASK